jgi:NAD(P)-dependent dehydrogenase (short-subunit alcohol dehydrogenase family)
VSLLTGADSGIGKSLAILYAKEGADVAIMYLNEQVDVYDTVEQLKQYGKKFLLIL